MKNFVLNRKEDASGVSGTGIVAEGVQFTDGQCVLHWFGEFRTTETGYRSVDDLLRIHGHGGKTEIVWKEGPMSDCACGGNCDTSNATLVQDLYKQLDTLGSILESIQEKQDEILSRVEELELPVGTGFSIEE